MDLAKSDPVLANALKMIGAPLIRARPGGYQGLFRIIIEQQVSVPSAQAILARCETNLPVITAQTMAKISEQSLREVGLSGPKIRYVQGAAASVLSGTLDLASLSQLNNDDAAEHLIKVKGVGPWTAAIYLLFCEGRLDIWPRGDVALRAAWMAASDTAQKPVMAEFDHHCEAWAPWRGMLRRISSGLIMPIFRGRKPI